MVATSASTQFYLWNLSFFYCSLEAKSQGDGGLCFNFNAYVCSRIFIWVRKNHTWNLERSASFGRTENVSADKMAQLVTVVATQALGLQTKSSINKLGMSWNIFIQNMWRIWILVKSRTYPEEEFDIVGRSPRANEGQDQKANLEQQISWNVYRIGCLFFSLHNKSISTTKNTIIQKIKTFLNQPLMHCSEVRFLMERTLFLASKPRICSPCSNE